ncbi:MAG: hypothetical protein QM696_11915 [Steroidobacteraceae bacterium]
MKAGVLAAWVLSLSTLIAGNASAAAAPEKPALPQPARLADGKPNLTGFWTPVGGLMERNFGPGAVAGPPRSTNGTQVPASRHPPLKSPYKEKYETVREASARGQVLYDPTALCLPPGMPRMMSAIYGMEILQTPGQITITGEWQAAQRRIWLDGRKQVDLDEVLPAYAGYSVGRWEGDTLVVDTIGVRDDVLIEQSGLPISDALRLTERIQLSKDEPGILVDEITIDDPKVFTEPWTRTFRYRYRPELNIQEYVCLENNRNVDSNGAPVFDQQ